MLLGVVGNNTDNEKPSNEQDVTTNQLNNDSDNLAQKDADMSAKIATDLSPEKKENSPPIITGSPHLEVQQGEEYTFTPLSKDPENDKLKYTISNKPRWLKFDTIKVQISYIDNIDFPEEDIQSESFVVVNVNEERFSTKKADHLTLEEDSKAKNFPIFAEGTDNLHKNITYLNNNSEIANVVIADKNKLNITPIENQHGESIITVTSTSNGKEVKRFFYLLINNVNDQPEITSTANLKAKEDELYKYQIKTTDDDLSLIHI